MCRYILGWGISEPILAKSHALAYVCTLPIKHLRMDFDQSVCSDRFSFEREVIIIYFFSILISLLIIFYLFIIIIYFFLAMMKTD